MATILIWLALGLILVSLAMMVLFGLRNAGTFLSQSKLGLAAFALPALLLVILFALAGGTGEAYGGWATAAVWTAAAMTVLGILALLVFGLKGLFTS